MKRLVAVLLVLVLLLSLAGTAFAKKKTHGIMYVYTPNGKSLNVRSTPETGDNIIGHIAYADKVKVTEFQGSWACIQYSPDLIAYVQKRYLVWERPDPPEPQPTPKPTESPAEKENEQRKAELKSEVDIAPLALEAHATRSTGWVNMRRGPSKDTQRIEAMADGTQLTATAKTTNWYKVTDPATGKSGYVHKNYVIAAPVQEAVVDEETKIGELNVNGDFLLQGKIPDGYTLQVISSRDSKLIAALIANDMKKPQMMLTVSLDEQYSDVERMNDLSEDEIETLKATFTDMNEVEFSESETSHGTKLLIAKETGDDEDFVNILSLYKGYLIEFMLTPNPESAEKKLTEKQIKKCIEFLSDLDFVAVE